jgi:hypothetical protein
VAQKAYGYARDGWVEDGPTELIEVTFQASPKFLRRVAEHLLAAASALEPDDHFDHVHLQDEWSHWSDDMPDVVVARLP